MNENRYAALDDYALHHLPRHLAEAGRQETLLALMNLEFAAAVRRRTRSDALFTTQLALARAEALDPDSRDVAAALRLMFTEVGLTASADALSPWAPVLAARLGDLDHALDLVELIRSDAARATALVIVLRSAIADGVLTTSTARRARQVGEASSAGGYGVAVLVALADALRAAGERREALDLLAGAKDAVAHAARGLVSGSDIEDLTSAYLRADELEEATVSADLDALGVEATSLRAAIARRARELDRLETARAAVTAGAGIPEWVNASYGLHGEDLFALAAEADAAGLRKVARRIRKRAFANGDDSIYTAYELLAAAREASRSGDDAKAVRLVRDAAREAADEFSGSFRAEAWAAVARAAHDLNEAALCDVALDRCLEAALAADVFRIDGAITELLDVANAGGRLERILPPLTRQLGDGPFLAPTDYHSRADDDLLDAPWVVGAWADLLVKVAKADPHAPVERLREARRAIVRRAAPADSVGALGMAFADAGSLDDVRQVLELLGTLRRPLATDEAKALVLDSCAIESLRFGDVRSASAWLDEARGLIALSDAVEMPDHTSDAGTLEWAARHLLERHIESGSGSAADARAWADLIAELPPAADEPDVALEEAHRQEAAMGRAIGNVDLELPLKLAGAVAGLLLTGRHRDALSACRDIAYWRLLRYTETSPLDASERGTYELIFETSRIHAACLVRVAEAAAVVRSDVAELGAELLADSRRIPYDGIRYCAMLGIGQALARCAEASPVALAFLEQSLSSGRDELLSSTAAVMPMLAATEDPSFLPAVRDRLELAGERWQPPQPIVIRPARSRPGQMRTFDLVWDADR